MNTNFSNLEIVTQDLPNAEAVTYKPIEKKYLLASLVSLWLYASIPVIIFFSIQYFSDDKIENKWLMIGVGAYLAFLLLVSTTILLGFRIRGYALRENDILYKRGLIWRKTTIIPFNRIQHSEISQGPFERLLKLSKLEIYTAGGSQSDLTIAGLKDDDAQNMRAFVLEKIKGKA